MLSEAKMDAELGRLIEELATTPHADDVTDAQIEAEIQAVRPGNG